MHSQQSVNLPAKLNDPEARKLRLFASKGARNGYFHYLAVNQECNCFLSVGRIALSSRGSDSPLVGI